LENNFEYNDLFLGVDLNLYTSERKPQSLDNIILRTAVWDTGTEGVRYETIEDLTYGQGLLLNGYSTLDFTPVKYPNSAVGLRGYYLSDYFDVDAFATYSHLYGARVSEDVFGLFTFGQTYLSAADGEKIVSRKGIENTIEPRSGVACDIWAPIVGDFDLYAEAAKLNGSGSGYSLGVHWGYNVIFAYINGNAEIRHAEPGFVPGYFGWGYEMDPVDISSFESIGKERVGYFAQLKGFIFNILNVTVAAEGYQDSNGAFYLDSSLKVFETLRVAAYIKQPTFAGYRYAGFNDGTLLGGSIHYDVSPSTFLDLSAKKYFDPLSGNAVQSSVMSIGVIF